MKKSRRLSAALVVAVLAVLAVPSATAFDRAAFEKNLTVHELDNGLTFLIYRRPTAPVAAFFTYVDVGAAQEVPGITGLAHMFEHMAFKGTTGIGTTDPEAERKALEEVDRAYHDLARARQSGAAAAEIEKLEAAFRSAQEKAGEYVVKNEFGDIIDREGGVGLNATTSSDRTAYFYSLPANKVELWAYLESERFLDPVFREFYKERDVVQEERRLRTESQPVGRMVENFLTVAFQAHPYGQPVIGFMSDLKAFTREDASDFYKRYYVPANMTIAIVGDVDAEKLIPILDAYFGRLPEGPVPPPLRTVEPEQIAEKLVVIPDKAQPFYAEGYHRPAETHPDDAAYSAMSDILSSGRTSRLYKSLVDDQKIAAQAAAFNGFPGSKYPNLLIFFAVPTPGHSAEDMQAAIRSEIDRIRTEPVSDEELRRVKTRAKAGLIRGLQSNVGIAGQLATYQARRGDWREIFREVDRIEAVTKEDILRVAQATFKPTNRTVVRLENTDAAGK